MLFGSVLVTGADKGLGLEFVRELCKIDGIERIYAGYMDLKNSELEELASKNPKIHPIHLLVDDDNSIKDAAKIIESQISDSGLVLLINNAGITAIDDFLTGHPKREVFLKVYNVNTVGPIMITAAFLPLLKTHSKIHGKAYVLNISSNLGSIKVARHSIQPNQPEITCYGPTKAALNHFTRTLAYFYTQNGIISAAVHPGWIATSLGGSNAPLSANDSAQKLIKIVENLTIEDSGRFMDRDGKDMEF